MLEPSIGYGNPPQLFLSDPDGRLRPSDALADAVSREHEGEVPPEGFSGLADLHVKSAASGDIDGDGDIDLWVQSRGGVNVEEHLIVNNGDGTFTIDRSRIPLAVLANPPDYWGHIGGTLRGRGQRRRPRARPDCAISVRWSSTSSASSLLNDGAGRDPARIELPHPAFYEGYTVVDWLTHFDVNDDGFQDLRLVHQRNNETLPQRDSVHGPLRSGARQPRRDVVRRRDAGPDGRSERHDAGAQRGRRRTVQQSRAGECTTSTSTASAASEAITVVRAAFHG